MSQGEKHYFDSHTPGREQVGGSPIDMCNNRVGSFMQSAHGSRHCRQLDAAAHLTQLEMDMVEVKDLS